MESNPDISRRFALRVKALEDGEVHRPHIMKFVKPRYNSAQAPLARSISFFYALLGLAIELAVVRGGSDPARISQAFLRDVTEECVLQAGMMADAGDENIQLTRSMR